MKLSINGRFLTQDVTGVQRVARELVKSIDQLIAGGNTPIQSARLLAPNRPFIDPPTLSEIKIEKVGRLGGHLWEQIDLAHTAGDETLLCLGNTAPALRLVSGGATAVMIHDLSYEYFPQAYSLPFRAVYKALIPLIMERSSELFTVSEAERLKISERFPKAAKRMHVVENGGLPDELIEKEQPANQSENGYALYVGSLSKRKNADGLLRAAIALARQEGTTFKIVGGTSEVFSDLDFEMPDDVAEQIEFLGQINDPEQLMDIYRNALCLVFPSHYESSGLPPMEAMSLGCPVVCSDIPALRERCADAAEYCISTDPDSIIAAVSRVLKSRELRDHMRQKGIERAKDYRWKSSAQKLLHALGRTSIAPHGGNSEITGTADPVSTDRARSNCPKP